MLLHEHLSTFLNFSSCDMFSSAVLSLSLPDLLCVYIYMMQKNESGLEQPQIRCHEHGPVLLEFVLQHA